MIKLSSEFDSAAVGTSQRLGLCDCVVYDVHKILEILMEYMSDEEALEHFGFNIVGSYVGQETPIFLWPKTLEDIEAEVDL